MACIAMPMPMPMLMIVTVPMPMPMPGVARRPVRFVIMLVAGMAVWAMAHALGSVIVCHASIRVLRRVSIRFGPRPRSRPLAGTSFPLAAGVEHGGLLHVPWRSSRSAFMVTITVAPVSARMASHRSVAPVSVVTRNTAFSPRAMATF